MWKATPRPLLATTPVRPDGHRSPPLGRVTSSCPDYLHADVSDHRGDLSLRQQEVTDGQLQCHDESCARYSRLRCGIGVSPLLPLQFTYGEGVYWGVFACGGVVFKNHHSRFINRPPLEKQLFVHNTNF